MTQKLENKKGLTKENHQTPRKRKAEAMILSIKQGCI